VAVVRRAAHNDAPVPVLDGISLTVGAGECVVLFGPNGCGKTTLLDGIAGRLVPDRGRIVRADGASLAYVFQRPAETLLPWRSVYGNVALPLAARGMARRSIDTAVDTMLQRVDLHGKRDEYPYALSGGEQQRLAIARALVGEPALLLLDEPFANVDYLSALSLAVATRTQCRDAGVALCCVTHDPDLAVLLADRIVVLSPRPAQIVTTIDVPLPAARQPSDVSGSAAGAVRATLLDAVAHGAAAVRPEPSAAGAVAVA
jgi:NitT/TauT family transport system ATP-binding protein